MQVLRYLSFRTVVLLKVNITTFKYLSKTSIEGRKLDIFSCNCWQLSPLRYAVRLRVEKCHVVKCFEIQYVIETMIKYTNNFTFGSNTNSFQIVMYRFSPHLY